MRLIKNKNLVCVPFYKSINIKEVSIYSRLEEAIYNFNSAKSEEECEIVQKEYFVRKDYPGKSEEEKIISIIKAQQIEKIKLEERISSLYSNLHLYQSKYNNHQNHTAIGEMTTGIAEEILNPLQVIIGYADMIEGESDTSKAVSSRIKAQVGKVEEMVKRLLKFASTKQDNIKIAPVQISGFIQSICQVMKSSLNVMKIETVLDLDNNIPAVLSNEVFLNQIFTNLFSIILNSKFTDEGLLIQLKMEDGKIVVRTIFTAHLDRNKCSNELGIISKLVSKHQGKMLINFNSSTGSIMEIHFPVVRKDLK